VNLIDIDHRLQMRMARERAVELRDDWGGANDRAQCRAGKPAEPCGRNVAELINLAAARLSELGRGLVPAAQDRCSQAM
jgi:hypothetical protein